MIGNLGLGASREIVREAKLLPGIHAETGTGANCFGIVSRRWPEATIHLNLGLAFDQGHSWSRTIGGIFEGSYEWPVRPALELIAVHSGNGASIHSALAALIWRKRDNLSFDFGVRAARSADQNIHEIRAGLTSGFAVKNGR